MTPKQNAGLPDDLKKGFKFNKPTATPTATATQPAIEDDDEEIEEQPTTPVIMSHPAPAPAPTGRPGAPEKEKIDRRSVRLRTDLVKKFKRLALDEECTLGELVETAMEEFLNRRGVA